MVKQKEQMVYEVPPYNDELDTNEAADYYETTNDKRPHTNSSDVPSISEILNWFSKNGEAMKDRYGFNSTSMKDKVNFMDTYESIHGIRRIDITFDQYKADLKEAFTDGIDYALTLSIGGKQDNPDEAFTKFFKDHSFRRKI